MDLCWLRSPDGWLRSEERLRRKDGSKDLCGGAENLYQYDSGERELTRADMDRAEGKVQIRDLASCHLVRETQCSQYSQYSQ